MRAITIFAMAIAMLALLTQCKSTKEANKEGDDTIRISQAPEPGMVVYKTKANYRKNVPVMLSEDNSKVVSYPAPKDLMKDGKYRYPTELTGGYLLDNKGIDENVAFLNLTYDQYTKIGAPLTASKIYELILEKEPLVEMYRCGRRSDYDDPVAVFNKMIRNDDFSQCKKLK